MLNINSFEVYQLIFQIKFQTIAIRVHTKTRATNGTSLARNVDKILFNWESVCRECYYDNIQRTFFM